MLLQMTIIASVVRPEWDQADREQQLRNVIVVIDENYDTTILKQPSLISDCTDEVANDSFYIAL